MVRASSGFSSDSSHSDKEDISSLVDNIISKLSFSFDKTMTVKGKVKKERSKKDRSKEKVVVEPTSATSSSSSSSLLLRHAVDQQRAATTSSTSSTTTTNIDLHSSNIYTNSTTTTTTNASSIDKDVSDSKLPEKMTNSSSINNTLLDTKHNNYSFTHETTTNNPNINKRFRDKIDSPPWSPMKMKKKCTENNNSDDECQAETTMETIEESVGKLEKLLMKKHGWKIYRVKSDGACLFRVVSHQIFGDEERHRTIRQHVMDYMLKNREHFSDFVSEDFDRYVARKRSDTCFGNHLEIQAISELYNRPVEIYRDSSEPMNVHHQDYHDAPLRLSYHSEVHYNSIIDPCKPNFGQGLGMPKNIQPPLPESELVKHAVTVSDNLYTDELLLRSAITDTEIDDLDDAIAQQALQESYIAFLEEQAKSKASCSKGSASLVGCSSSAASVKYSLSSPSPPPPPLSSTQPQSQIKPPSPPPSSSMLPSTSTVIATSSSGFIPPVPSSTSSSTSAPKINLFTAQQPFKMFPTDTNKSPDIAKSNRNFNSSAAAACDDDALLRLMPPELIVMNEEDVLAYALAQSRSEYMTSTVFHEGDSKSTSEKPGSSKD